MQGLLALKPHEQNVQKVSFPIALDMSDPWCDVYFWLAVFHQNLVLKRELSGYLL